MPRNFYIVLGVSRDADLGQIRKAHRRLVRLHHPDAEGGSPERFVEVQEAYETLSDEEARRLHDEQLPSSKKSPPTPASEAPPAEPLAAEARDPRRRRRPPFEEPPPLTHQDTARGLYGAIDEFFEGWVPGFFNRGRSASRRKDLYVELVLEPYEAEKGGLYPLDIPVRELCRACGSTGYRGPIVCQACGGAGVVRGRRQVEISMPARVTDGTRARLSLEDVGLKGVDLIVLVTLRR